MSSICVSAIHIN